MKTIILFSLLVIWVCIRLSRPRKFRIKKTRDEYILQSQYRFIPFLWTENLEQNRFGKITSRWDFLSVYRFSYSDISFIEEILDQHAKYEHIEPVYYKVELIKENLQNEKQDQNS